MAYSGDLVGKNVTTGKRNLIQNQDMMPSGNITLPVKNYEFAPVSRGERDTTIDPGGSGNMAIHGGGKMGDTGGAGAKHAASGATGGKLGRDY